jgi:hypothetical protein
MHKTICATFRGKPVENVETVENSRKPRLPRANLSKAVNAYALPSLERLQLSYKRKKRIDKKNKKCFNSNHEGGPGKLLKTSSECQIGGWQKTGQTGKVPLETDGSKEYREA